MSIFHATRGTNLEEYGIACPDCHLANLQLVAFQILEKVISMEKWRIVSSTGLFFGVKISQLAHMTTFRLDMEEPRSDNW